MWTKVDPTIAPMKLYADDLPATLYRYRSIYQKNIDRLVNFEIIEESIFLAGLRDLNDPDEGRFLMVIDGSRDELIEYFERIGKSSNPNLSNKQLQIEATQSADLAIAGGKALPERLVADLRHTLENLIRVACFTTQPVNYSMWANYAKYHDPASGSIDHAGICIEYQCDDGWRSQNLHPVEYTDDLPIVNFAKNTEADFVKTIYQKTREWRGEDEWRIMSVIQANPPFTPNLTENSKIKLEGGVKSVIFGMHTPLKLIDEIRSKVSAKMPDIKYKKVVRNLMTYNRELSEIK